MAALPVCTVCKRFKDAHDERLERDRENAKAAKAAKMAEGEENGDLEQHQDDQLFLLLDPKTKPKPNWSPTSERLSVSHVQVIFKLFELLKREFLVGYICTECLTLLEQADSLQFQLHAVIKALKERIDSHCGGGGRKRNSDVLDSRDGFRAKFRKLKAKKRALIAMEEDDARRHPMRDEDLAIEGDGLDEVVEKKVFNRDNDNGKAVQEPKTHNQKQEEVAEPTTSQDSAMAETEINFDEGAKSDGPSAGVSGEATVSFGINMSFWANVNDVNYIQQILDKRNYDSDFSLFTSSTKTECFVYDGHLWKRDAQHNSARKTTTGKMINAWQCSKKWLKTNTGRSELRQGTGCKARLATLPDDSQVILDSVEIEHNHGPNTDELQHEVFIYKLKEIVGADPTIDSYAAVARAEVLYGKTYSASFKAMVNVVNDVKKKLGVTVKGHDHNKVNKVKGTSKWDYNSAEAMGKKVRYQGELEKMPDSVGVAYDNQLANQQMAQAYQQQQQQSHRFS